MPSRGRAAQQTYAGATKGLTLRQSFEFEGITIGGAIGQTGSRGISSSTVRFIIGGSMFIASAGSSSLSDGTRFDTSATGQTGTLSSSTFSTDSRKSTLAVGQTGSLGSADSSTRAIVGAVGQTGSLGSALATQSTLSGVDVGAIRDAIFNQEIEPGTGITFMMLCRLLAAVNGGEGVKLGFPAQPQEFYGAGRALTVKRVDSTVDANGRRTVVLTLS